MTTLDTANPTTEVVVEGPGWRQVTGPTKRYYEITGYEGIKFSSISGLPWCDDFSGASRWMAGSWVQRNLADLATSDLDAVRAMVANGARDELDAAADRGSAVHHYLEALDTDSPIDWEWIERAGAMPWVAAVDAYRAQRQPVDQRCIEAVTFNPEEGTAGRIDLLEWNGDQITIGDAKSRTTKHDRRTKEAAQLGGYISALRTGGYIDGHGRRHVISPTRAVIVTFAPDGTYATHDVDVDRAVELHRMRLPLRDVNVANTFAKANHGHVDHNAALQARLDALDPDAKEALRQAWIRHHMPKIAEIDIDTYGTAVRLFETVEPFRTPERTVEYVDLATVKTLIARWRFMPGDLVDVVEREALMAGGGSLMGSGVDSDQADVWDHWIGLGEWARDMRHQLITEVLKLEGHAEAIGRPWQDWTDRDVDLACAIDECGDVDPERLERAAGGKRNAVTAAKAECSQWGLPAPSKFADVCDDVRVYAVTLAALNTMRNNKEQQQQ